MLNQYQFEFNSNFMMTTMNKQRGGTVLGLMIGVVLGLAAALAVAVFVTKTPSPFNNKMQNHSVEADATESKKNKDWDPNSALSGKNPAKPTTPALPPGIAGAPETSATASSPAPSPATAGKPAANPKAAASTAPAMPPEKPAKPAAGAAAPSAPPVVAGSLGPSVAAGTASAPKTVPNSPQKPGASDPINDLMKSKTEPKSSNSPTKPFMYFVQAGAFRTPEDAEAQRARLSLQGIDARVTEREQAGRTVYRVRSGPFNKEADADRVKDQLSATGVDAALVRVQR
jgi:cell division protein FtsN